MPSCDDKTARLKNNMSQSSDCSRRAAAWFKTILQPTRIGGFSLRQGSGGQVGSAIAVHVSWFRVLWGIFFVLAGGLADGARAEDAKRVLIVHSFRSVSLPFTTHSIAFETELTKRLGEKVDLDEVFLDQARFADTGIEEALIEYLQKRQAQWQPDLVVPIGSPAGVFVEKYRERLFPKAPILYTGMDRRRLGVDALKNAAFVGESFNLPGFVEDMLQLAPDTTNIVCVIGATPVERYWTAAFQSEFAPFTNRVGFTWLNDLPFDQTLERLKELPPHSFIFLILLLRDSAGVTHNADEALKRISEVANAPVNSIFEEQLGLGIVGGRLYRAGFEGEESARLATRILHGEPAESLPPEIVAPVGSRYDWRELRKWGISETRLPEGSLVKYRQPTFLREYRLMIVSGMSVVLVESLLIIGLVINRRRRRKAERALRVSERRYRTVSTQLIHAQLDERNRIARDLHDDFNQRMAALAIGLGNLQHRVEDDQDVAVEIVRRLHEAAIRLGDEIRLIAHQIHSPKLERAGFAVTLRSYCDEFSALTQLTVHLNIHGETHVPVDIALCCYHVMQEALQNIKKHARATSVEVRVELGSRVVLLVADNGVGAGAGRIHDSNGLGLNSMDERVKLLSGAFRISPRPGGGTLVSVEIPLRK
jgi:signal transduction histidine kinase